MNLPISITMWILALFPILILLILMIKFQWGAPKAAPIGLIITIINSIIFFKAGMVVISTELLKAMWNAFTIIIIIFTAILMYEVTNEAKALKVLKNSMEKIAPNELLRIVGIGVVFASFLQGVTGFGVPVAVTAPLLVGIGVKPMWAVIIPLLGHSWAGTFGTLAIAWLSLIMQTGIKDILLIKQTAFFACSFIWILNITAITVICWFYGGKKAVRKGFLAILIISTIQGGGQLLFCQINQVLACFIPSCIALAAFLLLSRSRYYKKHWEIENSKIMNRNLSRKEMVFSV
ncbi:L-lactate permease [Clostridium thailandense]|uniref:L-lactate permease n=1 Tax=Clostridium thailandense TaxID=2794346 RepID=UPI0039897DA6